MTPVSYLRPRITLSPLLSKGSSSGVCPSKGPGEQFPGGAGPARQKHSHPGIPEMPQPPSLFCAESRY